MSKGQWVVVGLCVLVLGVIAFGTIKAWNNPYAEVTKIAEDGTVWIQLHNMPLNTTVYLYYDDIKEGTRLEVCE